MATTKVKEEPRKCVGSARFGIEPHEAPVAEFPAQPSQKDGLGRMCAVHWRAYTAGLAREAKARKAGIEAVEPPVAMVPAPKAKAARPAKRAAKAEPKVESAVEPAAAVDPAATKTDPDAVEQEAILAERKTRVKAWRKSELEGNAAKA